MIYNILKNLITNGRYEKNDMNNKIDVFMTFDRITLDEYSELHGLVNAQ